jgi:trehalose 6-phosphate phosphatase
VSGAPAFSPDLALFLDIDGTVLDMAAHPDAVTVERPLVKLLAQIEHTLGGALALVSGRAVADIDRLFAPRQFCVSGQHGAERRGAGGAVYRESPPGGLQQAVASFRHLVDAHPGLVMEFKGLSVALHYRSVPALREKVRDTVERVAVALGDRFEVQPGKMVFEIKARGHDKGTAIADFMREAPFRGRRPVFAGDDLTDESGFALVNQAGGWSVKVGTGATVARWRVADAAAVHRWLETWAADSRGALA